MIYLPGTCLITVPQRSKEKIKFCLIPQELPPDWTHTRYSHNVCLKVIENNQRSQNLRELDAGGEITTEKKLTFCL